MLSGTNSLTYLTYCRKGIKDDDPVFVSTRGTPLNQAEPTKWMKKEIFFKI